MDFAIQTNQASGQIINGDYDGAIESLKKTWKNSKRFLSRNCADDDFMDCSSSLGSFEYEFFSSPSSSSFLKTTVAACSPQHQQLDVSIFRDPIIVRGDHFVTRNDVPPLDVQVCEQLYYVATYNLALSYHLKSVQLSQELRQESSPSELMKLRKSYYTCLHVALCLYEQTINSSGPVVRSMALMSNLGQIHRALGDHVNADVCMQCLLSTRIYANIVYENVDTLLGNSKDDFLDMIWHLISKDESAAAA